MEVLFVLLRKISTLKSRTFCSAGDQLHVEKCYGMIGVALIF